MPNRELPESRPDDAPTEYYYRRRLSPGELLPAIGIAVAAGLVAFYLTRLLLQRTPIRVDRARHSREADSSAPAGSKG